MPPVYKNFVTYFQFEDIDKWVCKQVKLEKYATPVQIESFHYEKDDSVFIIYTYSPEEYQTILGRYVGSGEGLDRMRENFIRVAAVAGGYC